MLLTLEEFLYVNALSTIMDSISSQITSDKIYQAH